jgi:hypothetical protein
LKLQPAYRLRRPTRCDAPHAIERHRRLAQKPSPSSDAIIFAIMFAPHDVGEKLTTAYGFSYRDPLVDQSHPAIFGRASAISPRAAVLQRRAHRR